MNKTSQVLFDTGLDSVGNDEAGAEMEPGKRVGSHRLLDDDFTPPGDAVGVERTRFS